MKLNRIREIAINVSLLSAILAVLVILGTAGLIIEDARNSVFEDMRVRTGTFARRAGAALYPREDLFSLHFLMNTLVLDGVIKYASLTDGRGRIRSHSDPERIGEKDATAAGEAARRASSPLFQAGREADGLAYFYFSEPVVVGPRRVGTVLVAINTETMRPRLAPARHKLGLIFFVSLAAALLLFEMRALFRRERAAAALKGAMVHTVSHEFNNALTVIDAAFFMLQESDPKKGDPSRDGLYRAIDYERNSLRRFVKGILNEARMEAGKFKIEKKPLALRELVAGAAEAMKELMTRKGLSFSLKLPGKQALVEADHEALALVVSNLLGNAVKYTPDGGEIAVVLAADPARPGQLVFSIRNTGHGISPEDLKKLKEAFFRTGDGEGMAEGFGLGLKVCSDMLRLHGSELAVESERGKYTKFSFSLPLAAGEGGSDGRQ